MTFWRNKARKCHRNNRIIIYFTSSPCWKSLETCQDAQLISVKCLVWCSTTFIKKIYIYIPISTPFSFNWSRSPETALPVLSRRLNTDNPASRDFHSLNQTDIHVHLSCKHFVDSFSSVSFRWLTSIPSSPHHLCGRASDISELFTTQSANTWH